MEEKKAMKDWVVFLWLHCMWLQAYVYMNQLLQTFFKLSFLFFGGTAQGKVLAFIFGRCFVATTKISCNLVATKMQKF